MDFITQNSTGFVAVSVLVAAAALYLALTIFFRRNRRAEENEARFSLLVESVKDYAIFLLDPKGLVSTWNKGAQNLKGYSRSEILGSHFSIFYTREDIERGLCEDELVKAAEFGSYQEEGWRIRKDGKRFWASVVLTALRDPQGQLVGFAKVTRDLTERKRNEEALRTSEGQLKEAQAIALVGSWEWDISKNLIQWSDELYRIFDLEKTDFQPTYESYVSRLNPLDRENSQKIIEASMKTGEDFTFQHRLVHKNGSVHFVQSRGKVILGKEGQPIVMKGTAQDITDQILIQQQLREAQEDLERRVQERTAQLNESLEREKKATEAKMQFLANMSHEIRTPMNAILGFSDLLISDNLTDEQKQHLQRIRSNGGQLLRLIDDILDLSKFEAGQIPIDKSAFSLVSLLRETVDAFSSVPGKKGLTIGIQLKTPVPAVISSDAFRLRQVLTNLLGNAIKFTEQGSLNIFVSFDKVSSLLTIDVEDTGIGISSLDQRRLFQAFTQADESIARKFGGTGLGLVLSRHIAQALDGDIELVRSQPGVGSCFRLKLSLPKINEAHLVSSLDTVAQPEMLSSAESSYMNLAGRKILLAEDSTDNEALIRHYLGPTQVSLTLARNGFEAVTATSLEEFDLILMDIQMPGLDGLEATRRIRKNGFTKPIIALTAHALREEIAKSVAAGCNLHLTKPIKRHELLEALRESLLSSENVQLS